MLRSRALTNMFHRRRGVKCPINVWFDLVSKEDVFDDKMLQCFVPDSMWSRMSRASNHAVAELTSQLDALS